MIYTTRINTPEGNMIAAGDGENIIGLWFENQKFFMAGVNEETRERDDLPCFRLVKNWLERYFASEKPSPNEVPLLPRGSNFRRAVWKELIKIPYGKTTTYGEIASSIAPLFNKERMSAQAVGGAVGHNPISIIIPCHRVIGADGSPVGYAGGIERKLKLLKLEGAM